MPAKKFFLRPFFASAFNMLTILSLLFLPAAGISAGCSKADGLKVEFSGLAKVLPWEEMPASINYKGIRLHSGRESIGPEERWMEILVKMDDMYSSLDNTRLRVTVKDMDRNADLAEIVKTPAAARAIVGVDMRHLQKEVAKLRVEWTAAGGRLLGTGETIISASPATPLEAGTKIPVKIDIPDGMDKLDNYPVRFGVPLPRGTVWDAEHFKVSNADGREIPSQLEPAGYWAEGGSVKWLWVDAIVSGGRDTSIYLTAGERTRSSVPPAPVEATAAAEGNFIVKTGAAEYLVGKDGALLKEVRHNGRIVAAEGQSRGLYVIDQKGRLAGASADGASVKLEAEGPVSAVIRVEGFYRTAGGEALARHITRLHFFAGRPDIQAVHTLVLTRDTNEVWFKDIGWEFDVFPGPDAKASFSLYPANRRNPTEGIIKKVDRFRVATADNPPPVPTTPEKSVSIPFDEAETLRMFQKEGVGLGWKPPRVAYLHGANRFKITGAGIEGALHRGEMMGDWAALAGSAGGWLMSCRDAAAQHPKEFEISRNRFNLKLFSPSAGKELDFRMETLMQNWGLLPKEKIAFHHEESPESMQNYLDTLIGFSTNAAGWSKTHEILLSPFTPGEDPAVKSVLHSRQVFAHVAPGWIRETRVLGALHPRDRDRFPLEETLIENLFWGQVKRGFGGQIGGFIDYNQGPVYVVHSFRLGVYFIRSDAWILYARSADRAIREFAQGANRAWLDGNIAHWNTPEKTLGLLIRSTGFAAKRPRKVDLPLYWEGEDSQDHLGGLGAELKLDYYMTGYRRAGDIMKNYADAVKKNLSAESLRGRTGHVLRHIAQAYELTWEPRLRELLYEITEMHIYDPESAVLLQKTRFGPSTYKMATDGDVLIQLAELTGDKLFYRMAAAIAEYNWDKADISPPPWGQNRSTGFLGYFLWEQEGDPSVAARFDYSRRRLVNDRMENHVTGQIRMPCISQTPRFFKGLPLAMAVLIQQEEEDLATSSWITFEVENIPMRLFFFKEGETTINRSIPYNLAGETSIKVLVRKAIPACTVHMPTREENGVRRPALLGGREILKPHAMLGGGGSPWEGQDLHTLTETSYGATYVSIPKDAPAGVYELQINEEGHYSVFADSYAPLSIHAPGGWISPAMNPPVRTYFNVPEKAQGTRIFFEKGALLFTPSGELFGEGKQLSGWVELPVDKPGLWSFQSTYAGRVKTENLPGFFSMGNPDFYMEY